MVTSGSGVQWVPFGFEDGVKFTGDNLMGSLQMYQAATAMSAMYTAAGDSANATHFSTIASNISSGLDAVFWSSGDGMYHASPISNATNDQIDVGGSALIAYLGLGAHTAAVSSWLVSNIGTIKGNGFIRQSNSNWGTSWGGNQCGRGAGNYDDGYWSYYLQWIAEAIAISSPTAAATLIREYAYSYANVTEYIGVSDIGVTSNLANPMGALAFVRAHPTWF